MSMHEIEDLIEITIRTLHSSDIPVSEKRQLFANCYRLQAYFDTSYTHFRLMDILLENDYMQTYRIDDFPLAKKYPDYYQDLKSKDFEYLNEYPEDQQVQSDVEHDINADIDVEDQDNDIIAVWDRDSDLIYVEFGTPYYTLHDETVVYDKALAVAVKIIELIHQSKPNLAYDWALFMIFYLLDVEMDKVDQLIEDYFSKIQPIITNISPDQDALCLAEMSDIDQEQREEWFGESTNRVLDYLKI